VRLKKPRPADAVLSKRAGLARCVGLAKCTAQPAYVVQALCAALVACAVLAAPTQAETAVSSPSPVASPVSSTTATIAPSLSPDRLGAKAALTVAIAYAGGEAGVPAPVRKSVVRFPAGLRLEVPHLRACAPARLLSHGASGCSAQSLLGRGEALAEAREGSVLVKEHISLWAFLGAPRDGWATVEVLGQGYTPQQRRLVVTGTMRADSAPYGEALVIPFPPIPTLPQESNASLVSFSLTIGAVGHHRGRAANSVIVPASCPVGGLPFGAEFTYANGSSGSAAAAVPCTQAAANARAARTTSLRASARARAARTRSLRMTGKARAARTTSFNESGHLHLVGKHGFTLYEQGTASGTATGTIYVRLTAVSTSRVTAEVSIYPKGGSITGYATASYRTASTTAGFSGSMSINRGTGSYAHAHGSGLRFSGTIQRSNDAVAVQVSGSLSD
jgi:hypothetical protein